MLTPPKSEIRKDYFLNKYVVITPGRESRPFDFSEHTTNHKTIDCHFCPGQLEKNLIIKTQGDAKNWELAVLKNKFPVFTPDNERAYGSQEVIIETPEHGVDLGALPIAQIEKLLRLYAERTTILSKNKKIDYILIFKNSGSKAGASLAHAHSQIMASEILPPDILEELTEAQKYQLAKGSCPYCDIIKKEAKSARTIFSDSKVIAFAPFASRYHNEAWIFSRRHLDNITHLNGAEIKSFAKALKLILSKLNKLGLSYNYFLHQVISNDDQHFYLKIQPRENTWGGIELGSGLIVNSVTPESAAAYYRL